MRELGTEISHDDVNGMIAMADGDGDGYINYGGEQYRELLIEVHPKLSPWAYIRM